MKIFRLPDLGEGLQEAELVEWRVAAGDDVAVDQPLVSWKPPRRSSKSLAAGRSHRALFAKAGDMIRIGAPLVAFEGAKDDDAGTVVGAVETGGGVLSDSRSPSGTAVGRSRHARGARACAQAQCRSRRW